MLDCQARQVCIGYEIPAGLGRGENSTEDLPVTSAGLQDDRVRLAEPFRNDPRRLFDRKRAAKGARVRADPQEGENSHPGQADLLRIRKRVLEPAPGFLMSLEIRVVRVEKQTRVQELHLWKGPSSCSRRTPMLS